MWSVTWKIKLSKQCNLRCRYCYEWNELDRPDRLHEDDWVHALHAARLLHETMLSRIGAPGRTFIVLHGGEPLLLPLAYLERLLRLEDEVIGAERRTSGEFANAIQTNLYAWDPARIALLARHGVRFGVSCDAVPGLRLDMGGGESVHRVARNLDRLLTLTPNVCGAVVLAQHTHLHLREIYRHFEARGVPLQINRLLASPLVHPGTADWLDEERQLAVLADLFSYWLDRRMPIEVEPLAGLLGAVLRRNAGVYCSVAPELAFIVEPRGIVYRNADRHAAGSPLGHVRDAARWIAAEANVNRRFDNGPDAFEARLGAIIHTTVKASEVAA
jgi:uncharacterized protein